MHMYVPYLDKYYVHLCLSVCSISSGQCCQLCEPNYYDFYIFTNFNFFMFYLPMFFSFFLFILRMLSVFIFAKVNTIAYACLNYLFHTTTFSWCHNF